MRRRLRRMAGAAALVAATLLAAQARAEGDCIAGYRDTTAAEREVMTAAVITARNAMPAPPEGWIINGDDAPYVIQNLCRDYEGGAWSYGHRRAYQRVDDMDARNQILQQAADAMKADMAAKQSRFDAIQARIEGLGQQLVAAATAGDYAKTDEINGQIEAASAEMEAVRSEGGIDAQMAQAQAAFNHDVTMSVAIDFNTARDGPGYQAQPWSPAGVPGRVFRWSDTNDGYQLDQALVLLGDWIPGQDGMFHFPPYGGRESTSVQSISLRVSADRGRIEQVLGAIDYTALQALMTGH
jgi:hypothetical protein